jgi:hypothetical protein
MTPGRKMMHSILAALVLSSVAVVAIGSVYGFTGWDAESKLALGVAGLVLYGVPMLSAAVAIVVVKRFSSSKVLMSCAAVAAVALAAMPALLLAHSVSCGWVGECI